MRTAARPRPAPPRRLTRSLLSRRPRTPSTSTWAWTSCRVWKSTRKSSQFSQFLLPLSESGSRGAAPGNGVLARSRGGRLPRLDLQGSCFLSVSAPVPARRVGVLADCGTVFFPRNSPVSHVKHTLVLSWAATCREQHSLYVCVLIVRMYSYVTCVHACIV